MRLPKWYLRLLLLWLFIAVPFWWGVTAFNGLRFFSMLTFASPSDGQGWQWAFLVQLLLCGAMIAPLIALPFAVVGSLRASISLETNDDAKN